MSEIEPTRQHLMETCRRERVWYSFVIDSEPWTVSRGAGRFSFTEWVAETTGPHGLCTTNDPERPLAVGYKQFSKWATAEECIDAVLRFTAGPWYYTDSGFGRGVETKEEIDAYHAARRAEEAGA